MSNRTHEADGAQTTGGAGGPTMLASDMRW
jgi:hypothetical protein